MLDVHLREREHDAFHRANCNCVLECARNIIRRHECTELHDEGSFPRLGVRRAVLQAEDLSYLRVIDDVVAQITAVVRHAGEDVEDILGVKPGSAKRGGPGVAVVLFATPDVVRERPHPVDGNEAVCILRVLLEPPEACSARREVVGGDDRKALNSCPCLTEVVQSRLKLLLVQLGDLFDTLVETQFDAAGISGLSGDGERSTRSTLNNACRINARGSREQAADERCGGFPMNVLNVREAV